MTFVFKNYLQHFILIAIQDNTSLFLYWLFQKKKTVSFTKLPMGKNHELCIHSIFPTPEFLEIFISFWADNKASMGYWIFFKFLIIWDSWLILSFYLKTWTKALYRWSNMWRLHLFSHSFTYSFISSFSKHLLSIFCCSLLCLSARNPVLNRTGMAAALWILPNCRGREHQSENQWTKFILSVISRRKQSNQESWGRPSEKVTVDLRYEGRINVK